MLFTVPTKKKKPFDTDDHKIVINRLIKLVIGYYY